jgi:hypothetical protein
MEDRLDIIHAEGVPGEPGGTNRHIGTRVRIPMMVISIDGRQ